MKNKELRSKLKQEFDSVLPDVLDRVMSDPLVNQPVYVRQKPKTFLFRRVTAFVCAIVVAFVLGISFNNSFYRVSASISIDINPSISIDINRFNRVIDVKAYNREAEVLLEKLNLRYDTADNAIDSILLSARTNGYITSDTSDNAILLSVWSDDTNKKSNLEGAIQTNVGKHLHEHNINSEIRFEDIDTNTYHHAQIENVSSGKIKLADHIIQYDSSFSEQDLLSKPVGELFSVYDSCKGSSSREHSGSDHKTEDFYDSASRPQTSTPPSDPAKDSSSPDNQGSSTSDSPSPELYDYPTETHRQSKGSGHNNSSKGLHH